MISRLKSTTTLNLLMEYKMFNMMRVLQDIVRRVSLGEAVYVKKEFQDDVSEELTKSHVAHTVEENPTKDPRVLFRKAS